MCSIRGIGQLALAYCLCSSCHAANTVLMWNWDNGTVENWSGVNDDTQLTIEPGRSDTLGLGATNGPPYASGLFPVLEITGQDFLPGSLVGNVPGDRLPMTGEIFIDTNRTLS